MLVQPAVALLALFAVLAGCGSGSDERPPNVILISLDTLRADHMSLYGYERETTPYLERLAQESLVFDRAHSVAPWTLISHVTMLTGLYPEQHGVVSKEVALSPRIPFLAQRLHDYGYQTIGLYKPGWIGVRYGHDRGFDVFLDHERAPLAEEHLDASLAELEPGSPYFLFLHLFDAHKDAIPKASSLLYRAPKPFDTLFIPDAKQRLEGVDFREVVPGRVSLTPEQLEAMIALYDGKIRYVDTMLEKWIEGWRADGLLEDTLIVITADHGENLGERRDDLNGHGKLFEEGLHIPMIVRFPDGYRAGERDSALVSLVDVVPTVIDAVGLDPDPRLPGFSLRDGAPAERTVGAHKQTTARIRWPWKLTWSRGERYLVNLEEDPLEEQRILPDDPLFQRIAPELEAAFDALLAAEPGFDAAPIPAIEEQSEALKEELDALGYAGEE